MDIDKLLQLMINKNGSDLFITAEVAPSMKVNGKILPVGKTPLTPAQTLKLVQSVMTASQQQEFEELMTKFNETIKDYDEQIAKYEQTLEEFQ